MTFAKNLLRIGLLTILLPWLSTGHAHQVSYTLPQALTQSPFNCTFSGGQYNCNSMSLGHHTTFVMTQPVKIRVNGSFVTDTHFGTSGASMLTLDVAGSLSIAQQSTAKVTLDKVGGAAFIGQHSNITGNITIGGSLMIDQHTVIDGNVYVGGDMDVGQKSDITGTCTVLGKTDFTGCGATPPTALHHFRIEHDGSGLTCTPSEVTVTACSSADTANGCTATTSGASGTLEVRNNATNALIATHAINIPAGQGSITLMIPYAGTKVVKFGTTTAGTTCWVDATASCTHTYNDAGFDFKIDDHISATTTPSITISAIRKGPTEGTCAPGWTGGLPVSFSCSYINPSSPAPAVNGVSGTRTMRLISGTNDATLTCGGASQNLYMVFDSQGKAKFTLNYPDVGKMQLTASNTAQAMTGESTFITYPKKLAVTWPNPSPTLVAGEPFKVRVTALNNADNATPNYGRETPAQSTTLSFALCQPSGGLIGASSGTLGAWQHGVAESSDSKWGEVGTIDVLAETSDYLGLGPMKGSSDLNLDPAPGNCTGAFGRFRPKYFKTALANSSLKWVYSGQPFDVLVKGFNAQDVATGNYNKVDGFVQDLVTLSANGVAPAPVTPNPGPGALSPTSVPVSGLADYEQPENVLVEGAVKVTPTYTFTAANMPVAPTRIAVCATDKDGTSSTGFCGAELEVRTGRLRLSNAFGSVNRDLQIPVRVEYWTGKSWLRNWEDNSTELPRAAIALSPSAQVQAVTVVEAKVALSNGGATFTLKKPTRDSTHNGVGLVNIATNLGATTSDTSCLATKPVTAGAQLPWLRSLNGTCNTGWTQDPTARANFGNSTPENRATIHVRESFN